MKIILASTSQIRHEVLTKADVKFDAASPSVDEESVKAKLAGESPEHIATALARAKALGVPQALKSDIVIGADQILSFGGDILNKPADLGVARRQLKALRGRPHFLETAIACSQDGGVVWSHHERAELVMRDFSDDFLEEYLASEGAGVCTSVGGYKLEGRGMQLFSNIQGDYFSILGLPLLPLLGFLRSKGALRS